MQRGAIRDVRVSDFPHSAGLRVGYGLFSGFPVTNAEYQLLRPIEYSERRLMSDNIQSTAINSACFNLIDRCQTLLLSSYSLKNGAEISYAPYVREGLGFYIFVSDLARHTENLLSTSQGSIMFIQPETEAANLFARERVIFNCRVREITNDQPLYQQQLLAMRSKFGETVDLLRSLNDFHLLQLQVGSGQYIAGFGKAYQLDMDSGSFR